MEQLDELVMRFGGTAISMKVRMGALEIEVDTIRRLEELVARYGGKTVAGADTPGSRATAANGGAPPAARDGSDGVPADPADPNCKPEAGSH